MILRKWDSLPMDMQTEEVKKYYDILSGKKFNLMCKRCFDIIAALLILALLSPLFLILALAIKLDSNGPVFYRQTRVTAYGKYFRIYKFRTMVTDADKGSLITLNNDDRITRVGRLIRRFRLDEIPQLIDVLRGTMTFVGTRPEVPKFVSAYSNEMKATLLMPAGITSLASIYFKDEDKLLDGADDTDRVYTDKILKIKMHYNLKAIREFSLWSDIKCMIMTAFAVLGKEYKDDEFESETEEKTSNLV